MDRWLGLMMVVSVAMPAAACIVQDEAPQGDESGSTGEEPSPGEQRAECLEAVESLEDHACPPGTSFLFQQGGDVADWVVVPIDEVRIDLPHGYLIEGTEDEALIAEIFVHNDECFVGCLFSIEPGSDACVGLDAEGNAICQYVGSTDVESCEELTEACAGG